MNTRDRLAQRTTPIIFERKSDLMSTKSALTFSELAPMDCVHQAYQPPGVTSAIPTHPTIQSAFKHFWHRASSEMLDLHHAHSWANRPELY